MIDLKVKDTVIEDIDLIIFDKDGTLFELYPYWNVIAHDRAARICDALFIGDPDIKDGIVKSMGVDTEKECISREGPIGIYGRDIVVNSVVAYLECQGYIAPEQKIGQMFKNTDTWLELPRCAFTPVKGIINFLPMVYQSCKLTVFSYDRTRNIGTSLERAAMTHYFYIVLGGDDMIFPKPHPWGPEYIMACLNVPKENTLLIGDSLFDIQCGNNAGCRTLFRRSEITPTTSDTMMINDYTEISCR